MILNISGATQAYLANLLGIQQQINQSSAEVSSGLAVTKPSDDPAAISEILQTQANIAQNQQIQANLNNASNEVQTADSALQSAIQAAERANLAQQVAGLQQTLVGISQTTYNGSYIFSGDQDTGPAYQLDPSQPDG